MTRQQAASDLARAGAAASRVRDRARWMRVYFSGRLRGVWAWLATGGLYAATLIAGTPRLEGRAWYWAPAAVVVALPLLVAGWRERRG